MKVIHIGIILIFAVLGFYSCNSVDKTDYKSVGKEMVKFVLSNDTNKMKAYLSDSTLVNFNMYNDYFKAYKGKKYHVVKIDSTLFVDDSTKYVDVYYKIDTSFHRLEMLFENDKTGEIKIRNLWANDMSKECNDYLNTPFVPSQFGLQFRGISWVHNNNSLKHLHIRIYNADIINEIDELKFRLKVFVRDELVINRTFVCKEKIYSGDLLDYEIKELRDSHVFGKMTSDNVRFEAEAIEAFPKPKFDLCEELKGLKVTR